MLPHQSAPTGALGIPAVDRKYGEAVSQIEKDKKDPEEEEEVVGSHLHTQ